MSDNIKFTISGSDLDVHYDSDELPETLFDEIKVYKKEIIRFLSQSQPELNAIGVIPVQESYVLSSAQRRLWILSQFEQGNVAYNMSMAYFFHGNLDRKALSNSFSSLIKRHEVLRTVFKEDEYGKVQQYVCTAEAVDFFITYTDLTGLHCSNDFLREVINKEADKGFKLEEGPLIRVNLYQISDQKWLFVYTMHHIIGDDWSMEILFNELLQFYDSYINKISVHFPPLLLQYKDYSVWQQNQLKQESMKEHRAYWINQFLDNPAALDIATDHARPQLKTYEGKIVRKKMSHELTEGIKWLSREQGGTLFMGLLTTVNILLYRYTGRQDITIGSPIMVREHADLERQIGLYVNLLALRTKFSGTDCFNDLFENIKRLTLNAYEHQAYPFDELINELLIRPDMSRNALFDVVVVLHTTHSKKEYREQISGDLRIESYIGDERRSSKFDLNFGFIDHGDEIDIILEYSSDLFDSATAEQLVTNLQQLIKISIKSPHMSINELDYLTDTEKHTLMTICNNSSVNYPREKTIVDLFEAQVIQVPDNIAISFQGTKFTYRQLNEWSNRFAHYLKAHYTINPSDLIGVLLQRSEMMIIAILGILKTGGAYVPIDPDYPHERIDFIITDTSCKAVVDEREFKLFWERAQEYMESDLSIDIKPYNLGYVIYTSGTTGQPKGVLIEHKNVVRLFKTARSPFDFSSSDVWTMCHSYCFDFSVWEIFGALLHGGKLVLVPKEIAQDPKAFGALLDEEKVTVLNQTPSAFYNLMREARFNKNPNLCLKYIIFGGEALNHKRLQEVKEAYPFIRLINMYGITETTVHVTYKEIKLTDMLSDICNIGKPIPTLNCYVLDSNKRLLPIGVIGELYVGGEGVARGYLNRESLTNERFIQSPFDPKERLYRSGDKVRLTNKGELEFMGRSDDQVKIRGYRIELGEIENALQSHLDIDSSVVLVQHNEEGEPKLVSYLVSEKRLNIHELRLYLMKFLPNYMLPSRYIQIESLPLNINGKVDKDRLLSFERAEMELGAAFTEPRNFVDETLIKALKNILKKERIGIKDDFFDLGGNSLNAISLINYINKNFDLSFNIRDIFLNPTVEEVSNSIEIALWMKGNPQFDNDSDFERMIF